MKIMDSDIGRKIGNTPLVELSSFSTNNIKFYAKLEFCNPFGSVKDRAAYWMIKDAEKRGILKKAKSAIIEPTSGNTGIALAGIARVLGYKVELSCPRGKRGNKSDTSKTWGHVTRDIG